MRVFVSYAGPDRAWADQVVEALEDGARAGAGVAVTVSHRDFRAGGNAVLAMSRAIDEADVVVILLSRSYLEEPRYTTEEWTSALMHRPDGSRRRVVPMRIEDVDAPALLRPLTAVDLIGLAPEPAGAAVVSAVLGTSTAVPVPRPAEHWLRSVRGAPAGPRFLFTGRNAVLQDIAGFSAGGRAGLCVVTGMPGAGKSAVLGALVVCGTAADLLPTPLREQIPDIGLVAAVHASDRSAAEIVRELAGSLGVSVGGDPRRALVEHLDRRERPPVVVVDALDEAATDVLPLLVDLARQTRLIVGVRSGMDGAIPAGLRALHPVLVDLDSDRYHSETDVAAYVAARLGADDRADGYGRTERWPRRLLVEQVGREVGRAARRNFLVAQFMTEELLDRPPLSDVTGRWSDALLWPSRVEDWMARDLDRRLKGDRAQLTVLLRPLAFADRGGLPPEIWRTAAGRFRSGPAMTIDEQGEVLEVLGFFVAVAGERRLRFSLRHQAFVSYFRGGPLASEYAAEMSAAVTDAVPAVGGRRRWDRAPDYVRWSALSHLAESGDLDALLADEPACLAAVVAESAAAPLSTVVTTLGRQAAGVFWRASYAANAGFTSRAAALQFQASLARVDWLADALCTTAGPLPWATVWRGGGPPAAVPLGTSLVTWQVAAVRTPDGRPALLTVGTDGQCTVLDAATQAPIGPRFPVSAHETAPSAVIAWNGATGEVFVAAVDDHGGVRVWRATGPDAAVDPLLIIDRPPVVQHVIPLRGPGGLDVLWIVGGDPAEVTLWAVTDHADKTLPLADPEPFEGAFAAGVDDGVITGNRDGEIRVWTYPADGRTSLRVVAAAGRELWRLLASGSMSDLCLVVDRERALGIRWWPPGEDNGEGGGGERELAGGGKLVQATLAGIDAGRLLATGDSGGTVQVWRLTRQHTPQMRASTAVEGSIRSIVLLDEGKLVATATWDGRVRVHTVDLSSDPPATSRPVSLLSHGEPLSHLIGLGSGADGELLATRSLGGLTKLWQVSNVGEPGELGERGADQTTDPVRLLATAPGNGDADLLAVAGEGRDDIEIQILDPSRPLPGSASIRLPHGEETFALAAAPLPGGGAVVCGIGDERISVWTLLSTGEPTHTWQASTTDEPTEHLVVLADGRPNPAVARGGPEGLHIIELYPGSDRPGPETRLTDIGVSALSASRAARDLLTVGTEEGILYTVEDEATGSWRTAQADHGEAITHAFPLVHNGLNAILVSVGRSGSVRLWDAEDGSISPRGEFQHLTEITHAAPVSIDGRELVAWVDLTGALQVVDVLAAGAPRLMFRTPGAGGRPSRLVVGRTDGGDSTIAVAYSSGRVTLADPAGRTSVVADLNCDLAALAHAQRSDCFIGAYGAALVGITSARARSPQPPEPDARTTARWP